MLSLDICVKKGEIFLMAVGLMTGIEDGEPDLIWKIFSLK